MWLLNFMPESWLTAAVNLALVGSVAALAATWLLSKVPFIGSYARLIRIGAIAVLLGATYFKGKLNNELIWRERVAALEAQVKESEEKAKKANGKIQYKVVEKTRVVKEKGRTQIEYINRLVEGKTTEIVKDMSEQERQAFLAKQKELQDAIKNCPVPKIIIDEQNKAAEKQ